VSEHRLSDTQLFGVPKPFDFEAVSAWLPRLALSQGSALSDVAEFLGLNLGSDVDRHVIGAKLAHVRKICSLPNSAFAVSEQIMESLDLIRPVGDQFMARRGSRRPRFRFCVGCLSEMKTPHFPIHWRFIAWRRCPLHDCLLEDACPHCGTPIVLPTCIQKSTSGRAGYSGLDRCLSCTKRLSTADPCSLQVGDVRLVNQWEDQLLANGRALLAALVKRSFRIEGRGVNFGLMSLADLKSRRAFPERFDWLSPEVLRRRVARSRSVSSFQPLLKGVHHAYEPE
jgi:hypothetical protein